MEEQDSHTPIHFNSIDMNKVLHTSLAYLNKKRKFQAEQLGMPLSKHMCSYRNFAGSSSSPTGIDAEESSTSILKGEDEDSDPESGKDSNSINGDTDSVMSGEAKIDTGCPKSCSYDQPSTSSFNWGENCSNNALYSLESRSMKKSTSNKLEQPSSQEWDGSGCHASLNYEEHLSEFGSHGDCHCPECRCEGIELCTEKEVEDLLYSSGVNPNNYVLSSGRWTVNEAFSTSALVANSCLYNIASRCCCSQPPLSACVCSAWPWRNGCQDRYFGKTCS